MTEFSPRGARVPPFSSRSRAATPAAEGAAAEVPKNRQSPCAVAGQVPEPNRPTPLTETPSAAVQFGARKVRNPPPGMPWQGPADPAGQRVVRPTCTGPAALKGSSGTVAGSVETFAPAA